VVAEPKLGVVAEPKLGVVAELNPGVEAELRDVWGEYWSKEPGVPVGGRSLPQEHLRGLPLTL